MALSMAQMRIRVQRIHCLRNALIVSAKRSHVAAIDASSSRTVIVLSCRTNEGAELKAAFDAAGARCRLIQLEGAEIDEIGEQLSAHLHRGSSREFSGIHVVVFSAATNSSSRTKVESLFEMH